MLFSIFCICNLIVKKYFFPLRYFLSLINLELVAFLMLITAFWCFLVLFVLVKSYRKKKKSLKLAKWPHLYYY